MVVVGLTESGAERTVYLELNVHGDLEDWEVRAKVSRIWPRLPRLVMYEGYKAISAEKADEWVRACELAGVDAGAPSMSLSAPAGPAVKPAG